MIRTYLAASSESKTSIGLFDGIGSSQEIGDISNKEVVARFLHTSARYLSVDIDVHELELRYLTA